MDDSRERRRGWARRLHVVQGGSQRSVGSVARIQPGRKSLAQVKAEFGFDPADDFEPGFGMQGLKWGHWLEPDDEKRYVTFRFFCPPEHLQALHLSGRFPVGS